ncbi:MAG: riboflavin synthase [Deltaproteobacteria bacterium]|nr:riboflavin synthase [Deltaproteobacteria bacterium]
MFTGIIEGAGTVKSIEKKGASGRITVETNFPIEGTRPGDSIAVNGVCLTVDALSGDSFSADVSGETLLVTTLGGLRKREKVNVERALTLSRPLGGHIVTGHIDGVGFIKKKSARKDNLDLEVGVGPELMAYIVKKGSVAVDGISLTVAGLTAEGFRVAVIPHTLRKTTLELKAEGDKVNIETDIIGKYVEKFMTGFLTEGKKGVNEAFLEEHGFLRGR